MLAIFGIMGLVLSAVVISASEFTDTSKTDDNVDADATEDETQEIVAVDMFLDDASDSSVETVTDVDPAVDELVFTDAANDEIVTGSGDDIVDTADGDDAINGGAGDDELHGGRGNDLVDGGDGDDAIFGHTGDDVMYGGAGADSMIGGDGADSIDGGDGDDALQGYLGDDSLIGGNGVDVLFGGAGDDVLDGRGDDDVADFLNGSSGDDTLIAGYGDNLNGGAGADLFGLETASNAYVDDFDPEEDRIEVAFDQEAPPPVIRFEDTDDGAILLADGTIVATFVGHAALDLANVPVTLLPV